MLIDLHAHSSGISPCCRIPYQQALQEALKYGMDGVVLTNHYHKANIRDIPLQDYVEKYIAEFLGAEGYGKEIGCKVYFGIEVTMEFCRSVHMLIYGVDPDFLRKNPRIFDCTQKELYELVKADNGVLVQAHPFRNGTTVLDPAYMDGVEINCHPGYGKSYSEDLLRIAKENHLIVTCGGDYHADNYHPKCGMFIPEEIEGHQDLRDYLLSGEEKELCIQEPNTDVISFICV